MNQIKTDIKIPTVEDMTWTCPSCFKELVHDYDALIEMGIPICGDCEMDMERLDDPTVWVGIIRVKFKDNKKVYRDEFYNVCLTGEDCKDQETRDKAYITNSMRRVELKYPEEISKAGNSVDYIYVTQRTERDGEYLTLDECKEDGVHLQSCDNDGYCNFCGEQE